MDNCGTVTFEYALFLVRLKALMLILNECDVSELKKRNIKNTFSAPTRFNDG